MNNATTKKNLIISIIGIVVGVLALVFGILIAIPYTDTSAAWSNHYNYSFNNNDYYDETYHLMGKTVNNLAHLSYILEIVQRALGYLLIIIGLVIILVYVKKILTNNKQEKVLVSGAVSNAKTESATEDAELQNALLTLKNLYEAGAITEEEYKAKRAELIRI